MLGEHLNSDGHSVLEPGQGAPSGIDLLTSGSVRDKRQSQQRSVINVPLRLRPASTSQRWLHELAGRIKNFSATGCGVILNMPPYVGDIYRFYPADDSGSVFRECLARCIRCHLIDEEVFEAGFQFLTPLRSDSLL